MRNEKGEFFEQREQRFSIGMYTKTNGYLAR